MAAVSSVPNQAAGPAWLVVAERELRDIWLGGRGLSLILAYTTLLSVTSYLVAANQALNFLEQRESVALTLQVAVAVGALLVLVAAADTVSGERERGTLETLLLTPAPRRALLLGKGVAALSLWVVAFAVSIPYAWYMGRGVGVATVSLASGLVVGSLLAVFLAGMGLLISTFSPSNRLSLSVSLFILLALFAPTQMPTALRTVWAGELLARVDPFSAGMQYVSALVINGHSPVREAPWLIGPFMAAALAGGAAIAAGSRLRLGKGGGE
jgi:ABC-2 type transport system permease protein